MGSLPIHAAIVHVPLGLAFVVPIVAVIAAVLHLRDGKGLRGWMLVAVLEAVLLAGAVAALRTGSQDEERVEAVVPGSAIERHEEAAEAFTWVAGAALAAALLVFAVPGRFSKYAVMGATAATLAVAGLGVRVGHAGGELVYRHGAASVYATGASRSTAEGGNVRLEPREPGDEH